MRQRFQVWGDFTANVVNSSALSQSCHTVGEYPGEIYIQFISWRSDPSAHAHSRSRSKARSRLFPFRVRACNIETLGMGVGRASHRHPFCTANELLDRSTKLVDRFILIESNSAWNLAMADSSILGPQRFEVIVDRERFEKELVSEER